LSQLNCHFYRAVLCVSAVPAVGRYLSVRLSVETALKYHQTFSSIIRVSFSASAVTKFQGTLSAAALNTRVEKICDFSTEIAAYLGNAYKIRPFVMKRY